MSGAVLERVTAMAARPMEHGGQRVVTLAQVDAVHGRKAGTARSAFRRHRRRMAEGRHYFRVERTTVSQGHGGRGSSGQAVVALTERGYLLLAKAFNDELAWQIQEQLVDGYFRVREAARSIPTDAVIVSRAELEKLRDDANAVARYAAKLAKAERGEVGDHARALARWRNLGPDVRALADLDPEQQLIQGVDFLALVVDAVEGRTPEARESRLVDLVRRLAGRTS